MNAPLNSALLPAAATPLRLLAETSPLGVVGFDAKGGEVYRNRVAAAGSGPDWQVHADDHASLLAARQALKAPGDRYQQTYRWVSAGGERRWISESAERLPTEIDGIVVIAHQADITVALDETARLNARLLRQEGIVASAVDPIITLDADLQVLSCNHAAKRLLGVSGNELLGQPVHRWLRPVETGPDGLLSPGSGQTMTANHANGAQVPVTVSVSTLQLRGERVHTLIVRDAREQQRIRQQLEASQVQQGLVLQAAGMGSWQFDVDADRLRVTPEARAVLGCAADELMEGFEHLTLHMHPADRASARARWHQAVADGRAYEQTYRVIDIAGDTRWVSERGLCLAQAPQRWLLAVVMDVTGQRQREAELAAMAERLRALGAQLVQVQEHERRHLARELHDEIGQQLTAGLIEVRNPALKLPQALRRRWIEQFGGLIEQVRTLSLDLSPAMLDDLGLVPALRSYAQRLAERGGLTLTLALDDAPGRFGPALENALFRIAQEATTNVLRHARATRLTLSLTRSDCEWVLVIEDDGVGLPAAPAAAPAHFGMLGMRERAALLGGQLQVTSGKPRGLRIEARLPVSC